jgi:uncharacterized protein DUF4386
LTTGTSPQVWARVAGVLYLITYLTGIVALIGAQGRLAAELVSTACYVGVTLAFFFLFRPVSRPLSAIAAAVSLVGCILGVLNAFGLTSVSVNPLVCFGVYCLLIGLLIIRSTLLPRFLGALMIFGGVGWLTFLSPSLAHTLAPYNFAPGLLGEGVLTLWLLVRGVKLEGQAEAHGVSSV